MASAQHFTFEAEETYDELSGNEPRVLFSNVRRVAVERPNRFYGDGAAVGAVVGAAGGTAAAAASGGNQVSVSAGGSLDFHFTRPLTVAVLTASGVHTE